MSDLDNQTDPGPRLPVNIQSPDPGAELFLLDGRLQVVARGVGSLSSTQSPGVYKLKVQAGQTIQESLIVVREPGYSGALAPLEFASPAPLQNTSGTSPEQMELAEEASGKTQVSLGDGSGLFVFAVDRTADGAPPDTQHNPAEGLVLYSAEGETLVEFEPQSATPERGETYAACGVALKPGCYRLGVTVPGDITYEQTVVAAGGWRTNVFLLQRPTRQLPGGKRPDLAGASISMNRMDQPFSRLSGEMRMLETARLALVNRRAVVEGELRSFLQHKFDDPMLGIIGGHLVLGRRPVDTALVTEVVTNLRGLLRGQPHPDVEVLALAAGVPTEYDFSIPPMLRRSWAVVVEASAKRSNLTPAGSLSNAIATLITNQDPWLIWRRPSPAAPGKLDFADALSQLIWPETARRGTPRLRETAVRWYIKTLLPALSILPFSFGYRNQVEKAISEMKTDDGMKELIGRLGLPRTTVEQMLDETHKRFGGT